MNKILPFICSLLVTLLCHSMTFASTINADIGYLVRAGHIDSFTPPTSASYTQSNGKLRLGFQRDPIWVRVTLPVAKDAKSMLSGEIGVRISPYNLSHISLFEFVSGRWLRTDGGAKAERRSSNPCMDGLHCFLLNPEASGPRYFRIETPGMTVASVEVLDIRVVRDHSATNLAKLSVASSVASILFFLGLLFAIIERSMLSAAFLVFQTTVFLTLTGMSGLTAAWFPDVAPSTWYFITHIALVIRTAGFGLLIHSVLIEYQYKNLFQKLVNVLYFSQLTAVIALLIGFEEITHHINLISLTALPVIIFVGVFGAKKLPAYIKWPLLVGASMFVCILTLGIASSTDFGDWGDSDFLVFGMGDPRMSGLVVALVLVWIVLNQTTDQKLIQLEEKQKLDLAVTRAAQHEEATRERELLIDMMTHEIRNPLSTIRFAVTALERKFNDSFEDHARIRRLTASIDRIDSLLYQASVSNRLRRIDTFQDKEDLDICELIQDCVDDVDDSARYALLAKGSVRRTLNREMLRMIVDNLVVNSKKYSPPGTPIQIVVNEGEPNAFEAPEHRGVVSIVISNHLIPDAHPDLSQLFTPYYRHPAVSGRPGLGLGLGIVKSAATLIGGFVEARLHAGVIDIEVSLP